VCGGSDGSPPSLFFKSIRKGQNMAKQLKPNEFAKQVSRLYEVACRVGDYECVLRCGDLILVVRHSTRDLDDAWKQFVEATCRNELHARAHLRYMFAVLRSVRGLDCVTLLELRCDVSFVVDLSAQAVQLEEAVA
jgi:hypothetical protein